MTDTPPDTTPEIVTRKRRPKKDQVKTRRTSLLLHLRRLSRVDKDNFKAWCARRGWSMTEVIENFMRLAAKIERVVVEPPTPEAVEKAILRADELKSMKVQQ